MKSPTDDQLDHLLSQWEVTPRVNPNFRAEVWAKLETTTKEPKTWGAWVRINVGTLAPLTLAVIIFSVIGGGLAARTQAHDQREIMIERYLTSIDPHRHIEVSEEP